MTPVFPLDPDSLSADEKAAEAAGQALAAQYQSGEPYHHICVDNFLPLSVVEKVREEALAVGEKGVSAPARGGGSQTAGAEPPDAGQSA